MEKGISKTTREQALPHHRGSTFGTLAEAVAVLEECSENGVLEGYRFERAKRCIYENLPPETGDKLIESIVAKGAEKAARKSDSESVFPQIHIRDSASSDVLSR